MVKLASSRDFRMYGGRLVRNRWEYINAGLYVFSAILLVGGFLSQFSGDSRSSGLVLLLIAMAILAVVNAHDVIAHLAGVDYQFSLLLLDSQLALVEIAAPLVQMLGSAVAFFGILLLFLQRERGYSDKRMRHSVRMLVAGPALWLLGSIHNLCQVYERSGGHVQILQKLVQIPFLIGSLLFLVGGVFNLGEIAGKSWIWLSLSGSAFFLLGGLFNVVKVFKMQQMDGIRLEKLRGGAQERLIREREGRVPLILEEGRRERGETAAPPVAPPPPTPYKDVPFTCKKTRRSISRVER